MNQAAVFPSLTASTVVCAEPERSPPINTDGSLVAMVPMSTSGSPHDDNFNGDRAFIAKSKKNSFIQKIIS